MHEDDEVKVRDHRSGPDAIISANLDHDPDVINCEKGKVG